MVLEIDDHRGRFLLDLYRHPEVAAKRPSKDTAKALGPSPSTKSGVPNFVY